MAELYRCTNCNHVQPGIRDGLRPITCDNCHIGDCFDIRTPNIVNGRDSSRALSVRSKGRMFEAWRAVAEMFEGKADAQKALSTPAGQLMKATMLEYVREHVTTGSAPVKLQSATGKKYKTELGCNIDTFRTECGLSFDKLEAETAISKSLILRHVYDGTMPRPRNLNLYAKAFSRLLGRTITVAELMRQNGAGTGPQ